jgi:MFS family permease
LPALVAETTEALEGIFSRGRRSLTLASILAISIIGFEALAVITVAPVIAHDLGRIDLYAWVFSSFLLAQIVGTVAAGQAIDRRGPGVPFLVSLALFGAGLLASGFAPGMAILIGGRALQGLAAGGIVAAIYAIINIRYSDRLRPRMLASISSAWVMPALIGPTAAGFIAEHVSWRAVFVGLAPLLVSVVLLSARALWRLPAPPPHAPSTTGLRLPAAILLSAATALLLAVLKAELTATRALLAVLGAAAIAFALRRLLPEGTMTARHGLPAAVAARGLFVGGFFCVDSFLVLALTTKGGYSATGAGLVISASSVSWTMGSWIHERTDARNALARRATVIAGVLLIETGIGILLSNLLVASRPTLALSLAGWSIAGLGIGMAHSSSSTITFALTPPEHAGEISASLQLADFFMPGIIVGLGGVLVELSRSSGGGLQLGVVSAFALGFVLVALALLAALHLPARSDAPA